ncbi:MAG: hypothetical protein ACMUHM_03280 [Thermoplasmatota archaeon]
MRLEIRTAAFLIIVATFLVPFIPPATGDGMPVYTYVKDGEDASDLYGNTFESRQLANIELLNSTHQRIDLFLSIFSLEPEENLTVLVPFRERPIEVDMEKGTDSAFLERFDYDRIRNESRKQDLGATSGRFAERTGNGLKDVSTSAIATPIGAVSLYVAKNYALRSSGGKGDDAYGAIDEGDDDAVREEVEEIAHYEFDGASVSVYSVSANATLEDFVSVIDLGTLPPITREVVEEYKDQYVAVIETEPSPPIPNGTYEWMTAAMPDTMELLIDRFRSVRKVTYSQAREMVVDFSYDGFREIVMKRPGLPEWLGIEFQEEMYLKGFGDASGFFRNKWEWEEYWGNTPLDLREKMEALIFAVYGFTDFQGHTLSVTTELNEGKVYFPLGTSKGWDNPISETVVILRTGKKRSLDLNIEPDHKAFIGDEHCYIVEFMDANPDKDVEATIGNTGINERAGASFSMFVHFTTPWAPFMLAILGEVLLFIGLIWVFRKASREKVDLKLLSKRNISMSLLNLVISAPVVYILFVRNPLTLGTRIKDKAAVRIYNMAFLSFIIINVVLMFWGMVA